MYNVIKSQTNFGGGISEICQYIPNGEFEKDEQGRIILGNGRIADLEKGLIEFEPTTNSPIKNIKNLMQDHHDKILYEIMRDNAISQCKCFFATFTMKQKCTLNEFDAHLEEALAKLKEKCPAIHYAVFIEISNKNFKSGNTLYHAHAIIWLPQYLNYGVSGSAIKNHIITSWDYGYTNISYIRSCESLLKVLAYVTGYEGSTPKSAMKLETIAHFPENFRTTKTSHEFSRPLEYIIDDAEPQGKLFTKQYYKLSKCMLETKRYIS